MSKVICDEFCLETNHEGGEQDKDNNLRGKKGGDGKKNNEEQTLKDKGKT